MVLLLILLICSALISGSEVALFSLSASDLDDPPSEREKSKRLLIVQGLLAKPKKLLATILIANNFINIAIVLLFASLSDLFFSNISTMFYGVNVKFITEVGVVTFLILLFGEILPKIYANRNNLTFSLFMSYPIKILDTLLTPINQCGPPVTSFGTHF
jgi:Mg2+/Co2+ transporter CorB